MNKGIYFVLLLLLTPPKTAAHLSIPYPLNQLFLAFGSRGMSFQRDRDAIFKGVLNIVENLWTCLLKRSL